jgi:AraC-like DNA-binding protein
MKNKNRITSTFCIVVVFLLFFAAVCAYAGEPDVPLQIKSLDVQTALDGPWKIQPGDDQKYAAAEYNDTLWDTVRVPGSFMSFVHKKTGRVKGILWLRKTVYFNPNLPHKDIGLIMGRIANADEVYFNGEKIGGMGEFSPKEHSMWNHPRHYLVPKALIRYGQANVIAVRLSYFIYGEILGTIALTNLEDWKSDRNISNFFFITLCYIVIAMGFALFIIFFFFYIRRRESQEYLFYVLQLMCGLAIILDLCTYWNIYGTILYRFKVIGIAWAAVNTMHPIFLHRIYDLKRRKIEIVLWMHLAIILFMAVIFTNEQWLRVHGLLMIATTTQIGWYNLSCHISALYKRRPYAKLFSIFGIIVVIGAIHDGFVYFIKFAFLDANILGPFFQYMIFYITTFAIYLGTSLVLVTRFARMIDEVEDLNTSLETFIIENALLNERLKESSESKKKGVYPVINGKAEEKIQQVVTYIHQNYTFDISREGLAATVDVHPDNLGKLFKMYTNKKMGDYINELRIKEAAQKLAKTDDSIIDIAFSVGFDSLRTFNRVFPKFMKVTPEKYRKIIRKI